MRLIFVLPDSNALLQPAFPRSLAAAGQRGRVCFEALDALGAEFAVRLVVDGIAAQMHLASDRGKAKIDGSAVPGLRSGHLGSASRLTEVISPNCGRHRVSSVG